MDILQQSVLYGSCQERSDDPTHRGAANAAERLQVCPSKLPARLWAVEMWRVSTLTDASFDPTEYVSHFFKMDEFTIPRK